MNNFISTYQKEFNLQDATFTLIEHEEAIVALVYKVVQANGRQYILKICTRPNDYLCEVHFLKYFADKIPVPHLIDLNEPTSDRPGAILMECLPGDFLKTSELTNTLTFEIGSLLAKIHMNRVSGYGDLTQLHHLSADPSSYFTFKFEEGISECSYHLSKKVINECQHFYASNIQLLNSTDGPCITHRDFRPGNVLVNEQKIQGIIDWSSARGSFAEEDFGSLVLDEWSNDVHMKKAFLEGYASIRPVPDYRNVMPLLLLGKAIATIGFTVKTKTWNNKNANLYQRYLQLLESLL